MQEYGFSLTHSFPYKNRIIASVPIPESEGQLEPVFLYIFMQ